MSKHHKTALFFIAVLLILTCLSFYTAIGFGYFAAVGLVWFLTVLYGSSFIGSGWHVETYCSNPSEKNRHIALTFDDGPHPMTLKILDVLRKHNAKATFFCIGKNVEKHPEIVRQIVNEGHLIGNHSFSHSPFFDFYGKDAIVDELRKTDALIEKSTGKKPAFFRPPYGVTTPSMGRALKVTQHKAIGWNVRSLDGIIKNEKIIFNRIVKCIAPGGIVLLHDTSIHTLRVLEQFLEVAAAQNYNVVSLEELLNIKAYEN